MVGGLRPHPIDHLTEQSEIPPLFIIQYSLIPEG